MFAIGNDFIGASVVQIPVHWAVQVAPCPFMMLIYSVQFFFRLVITFVFLPGPEDKNRCMHNTYSHG
jgi:hypothetical protein